jgi:hypothetical protein
LILRRIVGNGVQAHVVRAADALGDRADVDIAVTDQPAFFGLAIGGG